MIMTAELIKVMKLLTENGIEAISYKGPLLSQLIHKNITFRQYCDLDILVDENDLDKAINILSQNSFNTDETEYKNIMQNKSVFHDISLYKNSIHVELHWRLFSDEFRTDLKKVNIKENLSQVTISNYTFNSFENEILIVYLAIHGAKHQWERIEWLLDIVKIFQNHTIDWQRLLEITATSKTKKILFSTLYLCQNILDLELPIEIQKYLDDKKILKLSKEIEKDFYANFSGSLLQKVQTKTISKKQYDMLEGYTNKSSFLISLLKPTELDFKTIELPKHLYFFYYFIRPFNILQRWLKKI